MTIKLLNKHNLEFLSLTGGCTGSSESTLVKMPHCWKSHVTAHMCVFVILCIFLAVPWVGLSSVTVAFLCLSWILLPTVKYDSAWKYFTILFGL